MKTITTKTTHGRQYVTGIINIIEMEQDNGNGNKRCNIA
jgi:hypothetical protein